MLTYDRSVPEGKSRLKEARRKRLRRAYEILKTNLPIHFYPTTDMPQKVSQSQQGQDAQGGRTAKAATRLMKCSLSGEAELFLCTPNRAVGRGRLRWLLRLLLDQGIG